MLLVLAEDPDARLRDVAARVGITERAVQKIVRDLQAEGVVEVSRHGRRNRYRINARKSLQHPLTVSRTVGQLLALMRGQRAITEDRDAAETQTGAGRRAAAASAPPGDGAANESRAAKAKQTKPVSPPEEVAPDSPEKAKGKPAKASKKDKEPASPGAAGKRRARKGRNPDGQQGSLF